MRHVFEHTQAGGRRVCALVEEAAPFVRRGRLSVCCQRRRDVVRDVAGRSWSNTILPRWRITLLAGYFCTVPLHATITGTALVLSSTGHIFKVTMPAGTWDTVISKSRFNNYHSLYGPCFSPDGRRIAYSRYQLNTGAQDGVHILIADNDGNNITDLCQGFRGTAYNSVWCSWADNGYIYWSEGDDRVMRVNVATRAREIVARLSDFTGPRPTENRIDALKVSRDGTRGAFMICGVGYCISLDFVTKISRDYGAGCQGTVSPNGQLVTHSAFGGNWNYHQRGLIHDFVSQAVVDSFFPPGAVPGCNSGCPRFVDIRFSHSSDSTIVFSGEDALDGRGYVHNLRSNETALIGNCKPFDFWCGTLPPPPAQAPRIALDSSALHFSSFNGSVPAAKVVTVTNSGVGTLGTVSLQGIPPWLTIVRGGSGNTQTLTNSVNPAGLAAAVYTATITVSAAGAGNTANYTVTFNVARSVLAPSNLRVTAQANRTAQLTWTDNADNESGFLIYRKADAGAWQRVRTTAANVVTWSDTGLTELVMYHYRLRAYNATDTSGYSNEDSVQFQPVRTVTLTSPVGGEQWQVGSTQYIRWTAQNVPLVEAYYSLDDGEHYLLIGEGAISTTSPFWGNLPFVVPDVAVPSIIIRVQEYSNPGVSDVSGGVTIIRGQSANGMLVRRNISATCIHSAALLPDGSVRFAYESGGWGDISAVLHDTRGRLVAAMVLPGGAGVREHVWRPSAARGTDPLVLSLRVAGTVVQRRKVTHGR